MAQETTKETKRDAVVQSIQGVVVSDKMQKTRVIEVHRRLTHTLYLKGIKRRSRILVHDAQNESKVGDVVRAEAIRPLSKNKNFRIVQVLERRVE